MNNLTRIAGGLIAATFILLATAPAVADLAGDNDTVELGGKSYSHEQGKVIQHQLQKSGKVKIWVNRGKNKNIFVGSTGVFYVGSSSKTFLKDHEGTTVRFRVTKVSERECEAIVFQGEASMDAVASNRRVVLRRYR